MLQRKLIETLCRRAWILAIPVLVAPLAVLILAHHPDVYESSATVWVTRIEGLDSRSPASNNTVANAAKTQVQVLTDLLATAAFRDTIALHAGLATADSTAAELSGAGDAVGRTITLAATGPNLVSITVRSASADRAQAINAAFIAQYQARAEADGEREIAVVVDYFQKQITLAQNELAATRAELAAYLKARPGADKLGTDTDYQLLAARIDTQAKAVERLSQSLQDAQRTAAAAAPGRDAVFTVQDAPNLPTGPLPVAAAKKLGYPAAAAFLGLAIAAAYLYLSYRSDHAIRSREDISALDVPVLGYVPDLKMPALHRFSPLRWVVPSRRNYARKVAASISPIPSDRKLAS